MHEPLLLDVADDGAARQEGEKYEEEFRKTQKAAVILRHARPDAWWIFLGGLVGVMASMFQAYIPYQIGKIIQIIAAIGSGSEVPCNDDDNRMAVHLMYLGTAGVLCAILAGVRGAMFTAITGRLNTRLRKALFAKLLHIEMEFYDTTMTGDVMSRLSTDTSTFANLACLNVNVFLRGGAQVGTTIVFMTAIEPRLSLLSLLLVPVMVALTALHGRSLACSSKAVQSRLAEAHAVAQEAVSSISTVKSFYIEASTFHAYASSLAACLKHQIFHSAVYGSYTCVSSILPHAVTIITLWYGSILLRNGAINVGELVGFLIYQQALTSAFQALGEAVSSTSSALGAVDRVAHLLLISRSSRRRSESQEIQQLVVVPTKDFVSTLATAMGGVNVTFRDVWFAYPSRPMRQVLTGLNLEVPADSSVAVVGKSGSGKSTLVNLIQRHYVAQTGSVSIDGIDIRAIPASLLKRNIIAHVPQEPVLFARSVWRNIVLGLEKEDGVSEERLPTVRDVESAARKANAHDFIMQLPHGYDTRCGERGLTLSGGQKQRIAIARALVRKPRLLVLDEATSSLDTETEEEVRREMMQNDTHICTTLIIAHRLSTVRNAPIIVVLDGGKVVEKGSHHDLLNKRDHGLYARLYASQWGAIAASTDALETSRDV